MKLPVLVGLKLRIFGLSTLAAWTIIGVFSAPAIRGQNPTSALPTFVAASIKPCEFGNDPSGYGVFPGKLKVHCFSALGLISTAYVLNGEPRTAGVFARDAVSGGPAWVSSAHYDIEAKTDADQTAAAMTGPMLRALLEDRFKVKLHPESKQIPVYELKVARNGFRLKTLGEGSCAQIDPRVPTARSLPPAQQCNSASGSNMRGHVNVHAVTLDQLASRLNRMSVIDRPVINRTGIAGLFDLHLEYSSGDNPVQYAKEAGLDRAIGIPSGPSIFTALEKQFGLKLEKANGSAEFLVIDHIERPSEN